MKAIMLLRPIQKAYACLLTIVIMKFSYKSTHMQPARFCHSILKGNLCYYQKTQKSETYQNQVNEDIWASLETWF